MYDAELYSSDAYSSTESHISKHAAYISRLCCELDLKKRHGNSLGLTIVENTRYMVFPYECADAEKVHA